MRPFSFSFLLSLGCASTPAPAPSEPTVAAGGVPAPFRLVFVDDYNPPRPPRLAPLPPPEPRWDAALGGLSGLYYDAADGLLYAVSDDTKYFGTRLYTFALELTEAELRLAPHAVFPLAEPVPSGTLVKLDAESLTSSTGGTLWIGSENNDDFPTQRQPRILRVERDGKISGSLPLPEAFLPESDGVPTRGPRTNLAFEGLTLSPSGVWLAAITETSLRQDGPLADFEHGTTARLLRWDLRGPATPQQFRYPTEPVQRPADGSTPETVFNGVSDLLSLDDERLLVLERAYVAPAGLHGRNTVRIFEVTLPASTAAPADAEAPPLLAKRLVLDLDDLLGRLEPGAQELDNFEGMTLGPRLPSGAHSLLLVSDDNFSERQRIVFLALRIEGAGSAN